MVIRKFRLHFHKSFKLSGICSTWRHSFQHISKLSYLFFILSQKSIFGIFIDFWLILNLLCSMRISESADCFFVIVISRRYSRNHCRFGVSSKRVLKKSCQLRVSVGNMGWLSIHQSWDHIPQSWKRKIDLLCFFQSISLCMSLWLPFRSCQIDQMEFTCSDHLFPPVWSVLGAFDINCKDRVRSRAWFVHGSFSCFSI